MIYLFDKRKKMLVIIMGWRRLSVFVIKWFNMGQVISYHHVPPLFVFFSIWLTIGIVVCCFVVWITIIKSNSLHKVVINNVLYVWKWVLEIVCTYVNSLDQWLSKWIIYKSNIEDFNNNLFIIHRHYHKILVTCVSKHQ